jgi:hypothetical protein
MPNLTGVIARPRFWCGCAALKRSTSSQRRSKLLLSFS